MVTGNDHTMVARSLVTHPSATPSLLSMAAAYYKDQDKTLHVNGKAKMPQMQRMPCCSLLGMIMIVPVVVAIVIEICLAGTCAHHLSLHHHLGLHQYYLWPWQLWPLLIILRY